MVQGKKTTRTQHQSLSSFKVFVLFLTVRFNFVFSHRDFLLHTTVHFNLDYKNYTSFEFYPYEGEF